MEKSIQFFLTLTDFSLFIMIKVCFESYIYINPVSDAQCFMKCDLGFSELAPFNDELHIGLPACL